MNIVIGNMHDTGNFAVNERPARQNTAWMPGDIISATLVSRENGLATLKTDDGLTFNADSKSVKGEIGETLNFQVIKQGKKMTLKQIHDQDIKNRPTGGHVFDLTQASAKTIGQITEDEQERAEESQEENKRVAEAIARLQRAISYMENNLGKSAAAAIEESGLSLDKISFTTLNRVMHAAKKAPPEHLSKKGLEAEITSRAFKNRADGEAIIKSLHQYGLPFTSKNIESLERTYEKIPESLDDPSIERLITSTDPITLGNLYASKYVAPGDAAIPDEKAISEVPQVILNGELDKFFGRHGIQSTPKNREAARFLLERGIPLDGDNVENTKVLKDISNYVYKEAVYDRAAYGISQDENLTDILLADVIATTEERSLAEIRLKYTTEASARLLGQRFAVDTNTQQQALIEIQQLSDESMARYLRYAGADDGPANTGQLKELIGKVQEIMPLTVNVHHGIMANTIDFTINGVHESVLFARAEEGYETFATVPNPKYGDSFAQVKGQFAPLLESMGISATSENIKAGFILSKNNMDINWENMESVKTIDIKINTIVNNLHPTIAANMIKEGLNPLDMHADQVLSYIKQYNKEFNEDGGDKISKYILEMDETGSLDEDTRKSMIAIYRMLYIIQKDGAASLGLAARQDDPLTLGSLMELSKYYQNIKKDPSYYEKLLDDAFGHLESLKRPEGNIRDILSSTQTGPRITYADMIIDNAIESLKPEQLASYLTDLENGLPLEDIPEPVAANGGEAEIIDNIRNIISASPHIISFLISQNIAPTPGAIRAAAKNTGEPGKVSDAIDELDEESKEELKDIIPGADFSLVRDRAAVNRVFAEIFERLDSAAGQAETPQAAQAVARAREVLKLRYALNKQNEFSIPVKIGDTLTDLNFYVFNESVMEGGDGRALMSLNTPSMGLVNAIIAFEEASVDINVQVENIHIKSNMENDAARLADYLNEAGFENVNIRFEVMGETNEAPTTEARPDRVLSEHEYIV